MYTKKIPYNARKIQHVDLEKKINVQMLNIQILTEVFCFRFGTTTIKKKDARAALRSNGKYTLEDLKIKMFREINKI